MRLRELFADAHKGHRAREDHLQKEERKTEKDAASEMKLQPVFPLSESFHCTPSLSYYSIDMRRRISSVKIII